MTFDDDDDNNNTNIKETTKKKSTLFDLLAFDIQPHFYLQTILLHFLSFLYSLKIEIELKTRKIFLILFLNCFKLQLRFNIILVSGIHDSGQTFI